MICKVILTRLTEKELAQSETGRPLKRTRLDSDPPSLPPEKESQMTIGGAFCSQMEELDYSFEGRDKAEKVTEKVSEKVSEKGNDQKALDKVDKKSSKRKDRSKKDQEVKEKKRSGEKKSSKETDQDQVGRSKKHEKSTSKSKSEKNEEKSSAKPLSNFRIPRKTPAPVESEKSKNDKIDFTPSTVGLPAYLIADHDSNSKAESQRSKTPAETTQKSILNINLKKSEQDKSVTFNEEVSVQRISPLRNDLCSSSNWAPVATEMDDIMKDLRYSVQPSDPVDADRVQQPVESFNTFRFTICTFLIF